MTSRDELNRLHHRAFPAARIAASRSESVTVCVPAKNEAQTIGSTVATLVELKRVGVIDQVIVVDDSTDSTAQIAVDAGAEVCAQRDLFPEYGPVLGKGDAMWRALSVVRGEVVCFVDADSKDFGARIPCGLIGAIALGGAQFAKGTYRRPFMSEKGTFGSGGGRVTELTAKPLLRMLFPELLAFAQPLAGEIAARRELLIDLPFATHYAVDIALLIDVWRRIGMAGMVEVDLEGRQNSHHRLDDLAVMAQQVAAAIVGRSLLRVTGASSSITQTQPIERPPLSGLQAAPVTA